MTSPEQWRERQKQCERFNRWEAQQPPVDRDPAELIADIGAILDWLPAERLAEDPDPDKRGIQTLRARLQLLGERR